MWFPLFSKLKDSRYICVECAWQVYYETANGFQSFSKNYFLWILNSY